MQCDNGQYGHPRGTKGKPRAAAGTHAVVLRPQVLISQLSKRQTQKPFQRMKGEVQVRMPSRDAPLTVIAMALHGPAPFAASHCLVHSCDTIATLPVAAGALSPVASVLLRGDQAHRARVRTQGSALRCPLESSNGICTQTVALTVATAAGPHASTRTRARTHRRHKRNRPHARTHAHMRAHTRAPAHTHRHRQVQPCEAADGEEAHDRIEANHGDGAAPWRRQSRTACNSCARNHAADTWHA